MSYFFRVNEDGWIFPAFSLIHILILAISILGCMFFLNSKILDDRKNLKKAGRILLTFIILEQVSNYLWIFMTGSFDIKEDLPLYFCRITLIASIIALITDKDFFVTISVYWGVFGGILALSYPVLYKFRPPHLTNIEYFLGHILILWTACYFMRKGYDFSGFRYRTINKITILFALLASAVNLVINANYNNTIVPPLFPDKISKFGPRLSISLVILTVLIFNYLTYRYGNRYKKNMELKHI
ncbi:MAG: TIGR02206 family membrane protein [Peptoniphilaceae bacterium]|nr:TIGR02206 family membrane protein [Peptoniphilaceae bacterium]